MKYDWLGRFFQGRLILWYFQFPAGINQSRVADQLPVQGNDFSHGAVVLSDNFPKGVALSDDVYPAFLILRQDSIGSAAYSMFRAAAASFPDALSGEPGPSVDVWGFSICPVSAADTGVETRESTMELQSSAA